MNSPVQGRAAKVFFVDLILFDLGHTCPDRQIQPKSGELAIGSNDLWERCLIY
jgi:hypothetical protein